MAFSWKNGVTYAAAFVLIVALSALLGRGKPDVDPGGDMIPPDDTPVQTETDVGGESQQTNHESPETEPEPQGPVTHQGGDAPQQTPRTAVGSIDVDDEADPDEEPGMGGQSLSVVLGNDEFYTYSYRTNDPTDPHKQGYPITVSAMHTNTGVNAFQLDISNMQSIEHLITYDGSATFVGTGTSGGVVVRTYDVSRLGDEKELGGLTQPGTLLEAKLNKNVLSVFTYTDQSVNPDCEVVNLPNSTESGMIILSTLDVGSAAMNTKRMAFSGASKNLSFYTLNAYIQYTGEPTEENEEGVYTAHILLDGTNIDYRGEEGPPDQE